MSWCTVLCSDCCFCNFQDLPPHVSKSKNAKFHKLFKNVPVEEYPIDCELCALLRMTQWMWMCVLWRKKPYWLWIVCVVKEDPLSVSCIYYEDLPHWLWVVYTCIMEEDILLTVTVWVVCPVEGDPLSVTVSCVYYEDLHLWLWVVYTCMHYGRRYPTDCKLCVSLRKTHWVWAVFIMEEDLPYRLWVVCIVEEGPLTVSCLYHCGVPTDCELHVVLRNTHGLSCVYSFCSESLKGESEVLIHEYTQMGGFREPAVLSRPCQDPFTVCCWGKIIDYVVLRKTHWLCIVMFHCSSLMCIQRGVTFCFSLFVCIQRGHPTPRHDVRFAELDLLLL